MRWTSGTCDGHERKNDVIEKKLTFALLAFWCHMSGYSYTARELTNAVGSGLLLSRRDGVFVIPVWCMHALVGGALANEMASHPVGKYIACACLMARDNSNSTTAASSLTWLTQKDMQQYATQNCSHLYEAECCTEASDWFWREVESRYAATAHQ